MDDISPNKTKVPQNQLDRANADEKGCSKWICKNKNFIKIFHMDVLLTKYQTKMVLPYNS